MRFANYDSVDLSVSDCTNRLRKRGEVFRIKRSVKEWGFGSECREIPAGLYKVVDRKNFCGGHVNIERVD